MKKKLGLIIGGIFIMSSLVGCNTKNKAEIEQSFDKILAMYPTKNLEAFYDMEGFRDSEFDKDDKGVWVLDSSMSKSVSKDSELITEGMLLRMNRNTKKASGYYYVMTTWNDLSKPVEEKKYPVIYEENKIQPSKEISDNRILEKINNFQFFVQYGSFEKLDTYDNIKKMYNSEVPIYELEYQLTNKDVNVKKLREKYDIPMNFEPTLLLKGRGDLEGDSVGYKQVEFRFSKELSITFDDSINFQPDSQEEFVND